VADSSLIGSGSGEQSTLKTRSGAGDGLCVGRNSSDPVAQDYTGEPPWPFIGVTIRRVAVDISGEPYVDMEREAVAMMVREQQRSMDQGLERDQEGADERDAQALDE
jgi:hypothetical protein